jgi:hypothetical protein
MTVKCQSQNKQNFVAFKPLRHIVCNGSEVKFHIWHSNPSPFAVVNPRAGPEELSSFQGSRVGPEGLPAKRVCQRRTCVTAQTLIRTVLVETLQVLELGLKNFLPNYFASEALEVLLKILIRSKVLRKAAATEMAIVVKVINTAVNLWAKPDPGEDSCPGF